MNFFLVIIVVGFIIFIIYRLNKTPKSKELSLTDNDFHDEETKCFFQVESELFMTESDDKTPPIIVKLRKFYHGKPLGKLEEMYFKITQEILDSEKDKDFQKLLMNCQGGLGLIEPYIIKYKKQFGIFDIKGIPSIHYGLLYNSVLGNTGQLKNIQDIVNYFPDLHHYKPEVKESFLRKELSSKIYHYVKSNPNCYQSDLKKVLNFNDGHFISNTIHYMEKIGKISKNKVGNKVQLNVKD